jgi:tRNA pseudouridine38-40 synthase
MDSSPHSNKNIKLVLTYDGTSFFGWQETKEGRSIEGTLSQALEQILQEKVNLQAASRTDRGVHALGQVVNFITSKQFTLNELKKSLNSLLPNDLRVISLNETDPLFHPTTSAIGKEYHYHLTYGEIQLPHLRLYAWHVPGQLNFEKMREGASYLLGTHDFSAFCNMRKNLNYTDKVRRIEELEILSMEEGKLKVMIRGNHFMYKMVRNIVGTLVYVGLGKLQPQDLLKILHSKCRPCAGVTAPAHGLHLHQIFYK